MLFTKIESIKDVVDSHLCCGCGACVYFAPKALRMVDKVDCGLRPEIIAGHEDDESLKEALKVCPGYSLTGTESRSEEGTWGRIEKIWEGFSTDSEIRFAASSGGAASALALFCLQKKGMGGLLHIGQNKEKPYLNETVFSKTREEILLRSGSRYSPASPCEGLGIIERADSPCVFIGKPCDVAAVHMASKNKTQLDEKLGLTISVFCASTPSTFGTEQLMRAMGVDNADNVSSLRYRGNGWPGNAAVVFEENGKTRKSEMTYSDSWGNILSRYAQWRCRICPDHSGEFADVAVCDPWYRDIPEDEPGRSLIMARTKRGLEIVEEAISEGYIEASESSVDILEASQPNLRAARGSVWGRINACRVMGIACPAYYNIPLFKTWLSLPLKEKLRSTLGTAKRVIRKKLYKREF